MTEKTRIFHHFFQENSSFFLWIVMVLSAYAKLWYVFYYTPYDQFLDGEMGLYWDKAVMSFYRGDFDASQWSTLPPLGHILLGWIFKIAYYFDLYLQKHEIVLGVNILLSTLSVYLVYRIALLLWDDGGYALLSAMVYAFFFPLIYLNAFVLPDHPSQFALLLSIWMLMEHSDEKLYVWIAGVILGVAIAIAPVLIPSAMVLLLYVLFVPGVSRRRLIRGMVFIAGLGTLLLGVSVHNNTLSVGKLKTFSANMGLEYYLNTCQRHTVRSLAAETPGTYASQAINNPAAYGQAVVTVPLTAERYFLRQGTQCLRDTPFDLLIHLNNIQRLWGENSYPNVHHSAAARHGLSIASGIMKWMMALLLLTPLLLYAPGIRHSAVLLLLGIAGAQWLGMIPFGIEPRFALRIFFIMDILGVLLLFSLLRIVRHHWWQSLLYLFLVLGMGYAYHTAQKNMVEDTSTFYLETNAT